VTQNSWISEAIFRHTVPSPKTCPSFFTGFQKT
jgi:hypothetical protein